MKAKWENEKQDIGKVQNLREEIERTTRRLNARRAPTTSTARRSSSTAACRSCRRSWQEEEKRRERSCRPHYLRDR